MTGLLQNIESSIQNRKLIQRREKVLVAVSGGLDSMVLLHALKNLSAGHHWKICVAHFNHQLRGRASDADEKLVRKMASAMKLPVIVGRAEVKQFAQQSKLSIEMAARKLRHEFLAKVARERKIKTIALAHHADDQTELFFLRLLRGAGGEGLSGMKWRSVSPVDKTILLIRPLLDFSKSELQEFARENKIQFREDETNYFSDFLRNRIRNELLPLLRKNYQPALNKAVLRTMKILGAESEFVGEAARQWLARRKLAFEKLPLALQRRVLRSQLERLNVAVDFELIEQLRVSAGKLVSIGSSLTISRDANGGLNLREQPAMGFDSNQFEVNFAGRAGEIIFAGTKFNWKFVGDEVTSLKSKKQSLLTSAPAKSRREFFDADKIGNKIILRHWRAGDRFQPIGLKSPVKLQDLFTNAKIPQERRRNLILAEAENGGIFWVEGLRISENFKITPRTGRRLVWHWKKAD